MSSPVSRNAQYERVDQGVDYSQHEPYVAIGDGTIIRVHPHAFVGGTGDAVYLRLDHPVTINGRKYSEVYYAEQTPLVRPGERVVAGQPIMQGGAAELGFARDGVPAATLVGGLGAGSKPTQAGQDFLDFVNGGGAGDYKPTNPQASAAPVQAQAAPQAAQVPTDTRQVPDFTPDAYSPPTLLPPGSGPDARQLVQWWQDISAQPGASTDTQAWATNYLLT